MGSRGNNGASPCLVPLALIIFLALSLCAPTMRGARAGHQDGARPASVMAWRTLTKSVTRPGTSLGLETPTAEPTPTPTLPRIQIPVVLREQELIVDGSFESGKLEPHWRSIGSLARKVVPIVRHEGKYSALLGSPEYRNEGGCPMGAAAIYQEVEIPQWGSVTLRFWYLMQSYDTKQFDYLAVIVAPTPDLGAEPIFVQGRTYWDQWLWSSGWREAKISLSAYRGQTVCIILSNVMTNEDGWYNTWTYIDDVRIEYRP